MITAYHPFASHIYFTERKYRNKNGNEQQKYQQTDSGLYTDTHTHPKRHAWPFQSAYRNDKLR